MREMRADPSVDSPPFPPKPVPTKLVPSMSE